MTGQFEHSLFGCFDNCGLCVITYFLPCYTFGKIADAVGDSCCLCGLLLCIPIANIVPMISVRGKVRESNGIHGSLIGDCASILCCPFCVLVQEAQEVQDSRGEYMTRT